MAVDFDGLPVELAEVVRALVYLHAPSILVVLLCRMSLVGFDFKSCLDALEICAGEHQVTRADWERGRRAVPFEIDFDEEVMDLLGDTGFLVCIALSVQLILGGKALAAPECSSWGWMNRHVSGRMIWWPLGRRNQHKVEKANVMVSRVVLLLWIWTARGVLWFLEQPVNSYLEYHPRFQEFCKAMVRLRRPVYRKCVMLGSFGGKTRKAIWLYCLDKCVFELDRYKTPSGTSAIIKSQLVVNFVDKAGKRRVTGVAAKLKASQAYPRGFGQAFAEVYDANKKAILKKVVYIYISSNLTGW